MHAGYKSPQKMKMAVKSEEIEGVAYSRDCESYCRTAYLSNKTEFVFSCFSSKEYASENY